MNELLKLLFGYFDSKDSWAKWGRKVLSLFILTALTTFGLGRWQEYQATLVKYQDLEERIEQDPEAWDRVKGLIDVVLRRYPSIEGVWLYNWPTAHELHKVHHAGNGFDPIPLGHLWTTDADDVGKLVFDVCTELNREAKNTACTVWGNEDAWGLIVVVWEEGAERPPHYEQMVKTLAHKIGHQLYPNIEP